MRQTSYALSYNVREEAMNLLKKIMIFDSFGDAAAFVYWYNKIIQDRGRITLKMICDERGRKVDKKYDYPFDRIGFNFPIKDHGIEAVTRDGNSRSYRVKLPYLGIKDFVDYATKLREIRK